MRKNKIGIDYFSHDVDMKDDKKIRLIIAKHGLVGYGIYNRLLEEIYRESGYFVFIDDDFKVLFSNDCRVSDEEFEIILEDLIKRGLFYKGLYEKYGVLTSKRIQENYCSATERRKEVFFISEYLLIDVDSLYNSDKVNVNINELNVNINELNDDIKTQSKVNRKESKKKVKTTLKINVDINKPENVSDQTWNDFITHRKTKKAPLTQTALNGFIREAEKAEWSLEKALIKTMTMGWQGFNADWVTKEKNEPPEWDPRKLRNNDHLKR